jgi:uncharacterized protein (TIGR00369 family)
MKKLKNPYMQYDGYNCFACSSENMHGLQMEFYEDEDGVVSYWEPKERFQGYHNVLHGGIQATLMDEIASWFVLVKLKTAGVTAKLEIKYKKPVYTNKGKITLKATLKEMRRRIAVVSVALYNSEEELCAEGDVSYFTYKPEVAKKKLFYPEHESFYAE